jgi:hypothetical protein
LETRSELLVVASVVVGSILVVLERVVASLVVVGLHLLRHWWKGDSLRKVWKWVDESSSLLLAVIEGASLSELAFSVRQEVLAWLSFVI